MNSIKFRLRHDSNTILGYEKWYSGSLNRERGEFVAAPCWLYSNDNKNWNPTKIFHRYKDLFTGRCYKSGQEMYVGDLVEHNNSEYYKDTIGEVIWYEERACFSVVFSIKGGGSIRSHGISEVDAKQYEYVGNIHETPELLK